MSGTDALDRPQAASVLILVVDDEPDIETLFRQQFRRDLRAGRFAMTFALGAVGALEVIATADSALILVLSDINMPGMTGLELLPRIKDARPDLPVFMITAYGDAATLRRARDGGAEGVYPKPIDFSALRSEIDARLASRGIGA